MSVLLFAENSNGTFKKAVHEAASYAYELAEKLGTEVEAIAFGEFEEEDAENLGTYGVTKVHQVSNEGMNTFNDQVYAAVVAELAKEVEAQAVIMAQSYDGKALGPRLAVRLEGSLVSGASTNPEIEGDEFVMQRPVNSGKGIETVRTHSSPVVISVKTNSYGLKENDTSCEVEEYEYEGDVEAGANALETVKASSKISITEADIVISGGRGFKAPENWGPLEEFAEMVGAGTACSKPVADMDWRPHHEHVGQTGIQIAPNLYIAIGISGAIQHLAGVNSSKNIVVINKDPEAPFFKHADYGIVGDLFEVLPKINEAVAKHKSATA